MKNQFKNFSLFAIVAVVFSVFSSCSSQPDSDAMYEEVQKYHDVAMEQMGKLRKGELKLKSDLEGTSGEARAEIQEKLDKVENAQKGMMTWMRQFSKTYDKSLPEEEKVRILKEELTKVRKVDSDISEAITIIDSL